MGIERQRVETLDRRQLLARLSASAVVLAAHGAIASDDPGAQDAESPRPTSDAEGDDPRILELRLQTAAPLTEMEAFYGSALGLPVVSDGDDALAVTAGLTEITFERLPGAPDAPFYHFAFNIPENKIRGARAWQLERTELFLTPPRLRDPDYPDDVRHFRNWNAHSVFFWDPAGNVLEYIARHDLGNGASGPFTTADILYASEIAFVVDDVPGTAAALQSRFELDPYRSGSDVFWASGDERGLLLLFKRGREIGDTLRGRPAPAAVFPTRAEVRAARSGQYDFPGFPYQIGAPELR